MADDIESILGVKPDVTIECSGVEASVRYPKKNIVKNSEMNSLNSDTYKKVFKDLEKD